MIKENVKRTKNNRWKGKKGEERMSGRKRGDSRTWIRRRRVGGRESE